MGGERIQRTRVRIPYTERPQFTAYHNRTQRWACIVAHRRAGKTVACVNDLILSALTCKLPNPRYAYLSPFYAQSKDVAWGYLKQFALEFPGAVPNESELRVDFPTGGRVRLYGAENYDRMRGIALDGVVMDEPADMDPRVFPEVIRPALSDRAGWATWIGTPKGHNHFHAIAEKARSEPDWFFLEMKASQTGILPQAELDDARKTMTPDQYEQEYECSFEAAVLGAFYAEELKRARTENRVTNVAWDRYVDVHTAWDLGVSDSTAIIFFQLIGREIHVVETYEASGVGLDHYAEVLRGKPYKYGKHYFPHDVQARELGAPGARSRVDTLRLLGINATVVVNIGLMDGINAVRRVFDRCWFDAEKAQPLVEALTLYRREFDEKRVIFRPNPLHDWTSHLADAMRMLAVGIPGSSAAKKEPIDKYRRDREKTGAGSFMGV
jgi:phage terminase large subunit